MIETCQSEKTITIIDIGTTDYRKFSELQNELVYMRKQKNVIDTLIAAEHPPVFTIGRSGSRKNLLVKEDEIKASGVEVIEVDRGGDITFHGPGQLLLYPVLDLTERKRDIHLYLRCLEEVIIDFLSRYNVTGMRKPGATGVWLDSDTKIGFIGIGVKRWVTYHGLSVNVNTPLFYFDMINPCGLAPCRVSSLSSILNKYININDAKSRLIESFEKIFCGDVSLRPNLLPVNRL